MGPRIHIALSDDRALVLVTFTIDGACEFSFCIPPAAAQNVAESLVKVAAEAGRIVLAPTMPTKVSS
jgi:hypothetical protein